MLGADPGDIGDIPSLQEARLRVVSGVLGRSGARRVVDLGCGAGDLLARLLQDDQFEEIIGVDVSPRAIAHVRERLFAAAPAGRLRLLQTSLVDPDPRPIGCDAAAMVEVIEHLDPSDLEQVERTVFSVLDLHTVVVTTPNREYNPLYGIYGRGVRHPDHRFEWTRAQFRAWSTGVARRNGYRLLMVGAGLEDPEVGTPTQVAVFERDIGEAQPAR